MFFRHMTYYKAHSDIFAHPFWEIVAERYIRNYRKKEGK